MLARLKRSTVDIVVHLENYRCAEAYDTLFFFVCFFFFQAEDGIRDGTVTGVQTCALPISPASTVETTTSPRPGTCTSRATRPRRMTSSRSAFSPSWKRYSPSRKCTLREQRSSSRTSRSSTPSKKGCEVRRSPMVCMSALPGRHDDGPRERRGPDRGHLLGDVDADRAGGEAPAAPDAPGRAELVEPGGELVRHPLPVAGARAGPDAAAVQVGEVRGEAGVPDPPVLGLPAGERGVLVDGGAEAGGADHRAVAAREATARDVVPPRVLGVGVEQVADAGGVHLPAHVRDGAVDDVLGGRLVAGSAGSRR